MKRYMKRKRALILLLISLLSLTSVSFPTVYATETNVSSILNNMTLRQKITQMMMIDFRKWDENLTDSIGAVDFTEMNDQVKGIVEDYDFGALLYFANNIKETEQSYHLTMAMQEAAIQDSGIPMIICADQEGGKVYRLGSGTALPGNMALGAIGSVEKAEIAGKIIGSELSSLGINTNLAPVVDINNNANNSVIGLRSYGDDPEMVGRLASASIAGMAAYNVIGCAKHFPGHGDTATDSHYGLPIVDKSKAELEKLELKPYEIVIEEGIDMIMTAHILYPQLDSSTIFSTKTGKEEALPATMSKVIITDLLKTEMGFEGIVTTDAINMKAISENWDSTQAVINAINAGIDMICMPVSLYDLDDLESLDSIISGVETAVKENVISEDRINDAVQRILNVKEKRGILDYDAQNYSLQKAESIVGSTENRAAERELAAAAVTVIKNQENILPLNVHEQSKILMLCPNDNERAQLVMGWNRAKEAGLIPEGAQLKYASYSSAVITDTIKTLLDWADTVFIISEVDSTSKMAYASWQSEGPYNFIHYMKSAGKKSIVISAEKPYDVQLYPDADAIMAVYGCKGSSADPTEALIGGATGDVAAFGPNIIAGVEVALGVFGAQGKLPVNIPVFDEATMQFTSNTLYPRGYGITYDKVEKEIPEEDVPEEEIQKKSIENCVVSRSIDEFTYTGEAFQPEVYVEGLQSEDYEITYEDNIYPGTAKIIIRGVGNYTGEIVCTFEIKKADLSGKLVSLSKETYTYNGNRKKPKVSIDGLTADVDYKVTYYNNLNAGDAKVKITGIGNYKGSIEKKFVINPAKITSATLTTKNFIYNGAYKKPSVTVKAGDIVLGKKIIKSNENVKVTYSTGRKKPGIYTVTLKGKGNYTGTLKRKFSINVKPTSFSTVASGKKQITVKWYKRAAKNVSGYQICYSTSSGMKQCKYKKIKKISICSQTIKSLKAEKKYYVQIRTYKTINDKNYYSAWSKAKPVTTQK